MSTEAEVIAQGREPKWTQTFEHPDHGDLTFTVDRLPTVSDWLRHQSTMEELAPGLGGKSNGLLAAAVAGMFTIINRPVLREEREEDPDVPGREVIRKVLYEPLDDEMMEFPVAVWMEFSNWRLKVLSDKTKEQVKNSSGATSGATIADSSPEPTESRPTTPA